MKWSDEPNVFEASGCAGIVMLMIVVLLKLIGLF